MTQKVKDLRGNFLLKNRAFHFNSNSVNNSTTRSAFSTRRSFRWSAMATWRSANNKVSKDKKPWHYSLWVFLQKIGGENPQNGWFIMENPTKMDDLEGTTIFGNIHIYWLVDGWTTHLKKYAEVKWDHFPRDRGENIKCFELPPPSFITFHWILVG